MRVGRKAGLIGIETHRAGTHVVGVGYALDTGEKNMQFNSESNGWLILWCTYFITHSNGSCAWNGDSCLGLLNLFPVHTCLHSVSQTPLQYFSNALVWTENSSHSDL